MQLIKSPNDLNNLEHSEYLFSLFAFHYLLHTFLKICAENTREKEKL
jgi:hypothetical protein